MNNQEKKRHLAYEALVLLGVLALLNFICRLWPFLLLMILGIFAAVLRLLFLSLEKTEAAPLLPIAVEPERSLTEQDIQEMAYSVILRRITELVLSEYPEARWVWEDSQARKRIVAGETVFILLNRAGGYRRARIILKNLQVIGIEYNSDVSREKSEEDVAESVWDTEKPDPERPIPKQPVPGKSFFQESVPQEPVPQEPVPQEPAPQEPVLQNDAPLTLEDLAFEWVEAHIFELNARCNEAIGECLTELVLSSAELPAPESWPEVCHELARAGLGDVQCIPEGIKIYLTQ